MADHARKQIRDAVKTALTGLTTTGANVFSGRVAPLRDSEMPGLAVYVNGDEAIEGAYVGGQTVDHAATLRIEGQCNGGSDAALDTLDLIAKEVEVAVFANADFSGLLMVPAGPPSTQLAIEDPVSGISERLGTVVLQFPIVFRTRLGDPTTIV